jgi:hypothetical protein
MFADNLASSLLHQLMAEKGSNQVDHMAFNISNITNPTVKIDTCSLGEKIHGNHFQRLACFGLHPRCFLSPFVGMLIPYCLHKKII